MAGKVAKEDLPQAVKKITEAQQGKELVEEANLMATIVGIAEVAIETITEAIEEEREIVISLVVGATEEVAPPFEAS